MILQTFSEEGTSDYVDEARVKAICDMTQKRINDLYEMSKTYAPTENNSVAGDVEENIAADYVQR